MFPYTGSIQALAAKNAYDENELKVGVYDTVFIYFLPKTLGEKDLRL